MGDWSYLRAGGAGPRTNEDVDGMRILLRAKYYVPDLLPALFTEGDFAAAPRGRFWFATRAADAAARLRTLWSSAAGVERFAVLWEGTEPVAAWLEALGPDASVVLDVRGVAGMWDPKSTLTAALGQGAERLAGLASRWSDESARAPLPDWLAGSDPARDSFALRRWTRSPSPRVAAFMRAFGWPDDDGERASRWQGWFDAGPPGVPMPDAAEEAERLRRELARRGLAVFSERPADQRWISQFLQTALRERTAETLAEVLNMMVARGMISELRDAPDELARALRDLALPEQKG
jgi:hypothetical protein